MPKKHTGVSQRKDGTWMAQTDIDFDLLTGKRKRLTRYGKTEGEAYEKLQQALAELRIGTYVEQRDMTVGMWFPNWLDKYAKNKVKQSTYNNYRSYIDKRIVPIMGHIKLLDLNVDILQRFLNAQYAHGNLKTGGQLSEKTIRNIYLMMHEAMSQAVKNELVIKNNLEAVVLPKVQHVEMRVLNKKENHTLLKTTMKSKERYGLGVLLALKTGMRIGEICGLRWKDIDIWDKVIHIRQTLQRQEVMEHREGGAKTEIIIGPPKSEKSRRDIPLPESLIPFLKAQRKAQKENALAVQDAYQNKGYVLMNEMGCYIEPRTLQDTFQRLLLEAGIEDANFHSLRHTYATRAVEKGMDIKTLSELLGHADVSTTMNRYAHSLDKHKRKMVDMMDKLFEDDWDDDF
jgi:integrase